MAAAILGDWQVNGVMGAYTGTPFNVSAPGASLNAPNNSQTANRLATLPNTRRKAATAGALGHSRSRNHPN